MKIKCLVVLLWALASVPVWGDDQAKAEKQLQRLTAMSSDLIGRRVVGITMADYLKVRRPDLVTQRMRGNLNYGSLFLARQLMVGGISDQQILQELRSGKNIFDIANAQRVDWKRILSEAKKLNGKVDRHLFEHFFDARDDRRRDLDENYKVASDWVQADDNLSADAVEDAATSWMRAKEMAMQRPGRHIEQSLNTVDELQFRKDHAREGAPTAGDTGMTIPKPR